MTRLLRVGVPDGNQSDGAGDTPSVGAVCPAPSLTGGEAGAHSARVLPLSSLAPEEVIDVPDHEAHGAVPDDPRDSRPLSPRSRSRGRAGRGDSRSPPRQPEGLRPSPDSGP